MKIVEGAMVVMKSEMVRHLYRWIGNTGGAALKKRK